MTGFTEEMDKLAAQLAHDANKVEKGFGDRLDAFKVLLPYYALLLKHQNKGSEPDDLPNFEGFAEKIHKSMIPGLYKEPEDGSDEPGVRDRRRNRN